MSGTGIETKLIGLRKERYLPMREMTTIQSGLLEIGLRLK